jgi:hypothetical protein
LLGAEKMYSVDLFKHYLTLQSLASNGRMISELGRMWKQAKPPFTILGSHFTFLSA